VAVATVERGLRVWFFCGWRRPVRCRQSGRRPAFQCAPGTDARRRKAIPRSGAALGLDGVKGSELLPLPLTPVTTVRQLCGTSKSMFFRLWTRAPRTMMDSLDMADPRRSLAGAHTERARLAAESLHISHGSRRQTAAKGFVLRSSIRRGLIHQPKYAQHVQPHAAHHLPVSAC